MTETLPLETYELTVDGERIVWPKEISSDAYTLVYTHSNLLFNQAKPDLHYATLYEAWAFDGKKSWHIWNRNGNWVCTVYNTEKDEPENVIRREQLLLDHFAKTLGKKKLIIHERIGYDEDNQAFIAYSCPIALSK